MFIQVIQGRTRAPDKLKQAADRWYQEVSPGARGWLGSLLGVTDKGTFIALVRFDSRRAARRNGERREQRQWWEETCRLLDGEVTVHDCTDVQTHLGDWPEQTGCVKIFQSRIRDRRALRELWRREDRRLIAELRPDILGSVTAVHPDGGCTTALFFRSVQDARAGEHRPMPEWLKARWQEELQYYEPETTCCELRDPWMYLPVFVPPSERTGTSGTAAREKTPATANAMA